MRNFQNAVSLRLFGWAMSAALCLGIFNWPASAQEAAAEVTGADLWGQAGCFNCHGNLADGAGDPAYPVGPNLRRSALDLEMLIQTIACGRPSTPMPMFLEGAYTETPCYGMPVGAVPDGVNVGGNFSAGEIALLADFLMANALGQARITRENCGAFFNGNIDAPLCRQY